MGVIGWMCGVGLSGRKGVGSSALLGLGPVGLVVGAVGWDGLDMLGERMIVAGSGVE